MRSLTAASLTKIAQHFGNEPVTIIEVQWALNGAIYSYADIKISDIPGQILNVSNLDNVINISESSSSQEISIVLDDTDGKIKSIMNSNDIHKRDVWVYQYFQGLALDDKFLLFRGKINTPIKWSEGAQTISFSVISQLEDKEIGFSPEEGQFPFIPNDLIGKPWPMIFGTAVDVPSVQITKAITGTILQGVGIISHKSPSSSSVKPPNTTLLAAQISHFGIVKHRWLWPPAPNWPGAEKKAAQYKEQLDGLNKQYYDAWAQYSEAVAEEKCERAFRERQANKKGNGPSTLRVLGGEDFPRGKIIVGVDGGRFTGQFKGDSDVFTIMSRTHPEQQATVDTTQEDSGCSSPKVTPGSSYRYCDKVPECGAFSCWLEDYESKGFTLGHVEKEESEDTSIGKQFWADAGSTMTYSFPVTYIVSIIPGTVLRVKAFKDFDGLKKLIDVPEEYYTIETVTYGSIQAVQITFTEALSTHEDQHWSDEIYVTFESSIGPNIIDILEYLINIYTDLSYDSTTFTEVRTKLEPFPANFAYLERKNIVTVLEEIAFQARCSLVLNNGVFYIKYLAEEPVPVDTITEGDIKTQSIEVSLTSTEDIITKYVAEWQISGAQDSPNKIILRHNIKKYGIQEETYNYYIYNQPDIILKIATFWLIRKSNSWKQIKFDVFLNKLNLETFDAVTLNFHQNYIATADVIAIVQGANFDSENQTISMECWLPIKSGEMSPYGFAWPAQVDPEYIFPTDHEIDLGLAGGDGVGANATGELPIGDTSTLPEQAIFIGGPNIVFGPNADYGDKHPSDIGFSASSLNIPTVTGELIISNMPIINLSLYNKKIEYDKDPIIQNTSETVISLCETPVFGCEGQKIYYLSDLLRTNKDEEKLAIKTTALFDDKTNCAEFDFEYDTEGEKWGAGTAFLQDG